MNGDLGVVSRIDVEEGELALDFEGREVIYGFAELDELVLAYATTIHKIQGSEYRVALIPMTTQHYRMLQRNLVYTGVTRGIAPGGPRWAAEGPGDRRQGSANTEAVVEAARMANVMRQRTGI